MKNLTLIFLAVLGAVALHAQTIYVSDYGAGTITAYTGTNFSTQTTLVAGLTSNAGVAVSSSGAIYVASQQNSPAGYISKYTFTGSTLTASPANQIIMGLGGPVAMAFDSSGNLYVANSQTGIVGKYDSSGGVINANFITGLDFPSGIAFDSSGNIYVTNYNISGSGGTVSKYDSNGLNGVTLIGSGLSNPFGIAVSAAGDVYVANSNTNVNTVGEYTTAGAYVTTISTPLRPTSLAILGNTLLVDNQSAHSVSAFALDGTPINTSLISGLNNSFGIAAIPEPSTYAAGLGLIALGAACVRERRRRRQPAAN